MLFDLRVAGGWMTIDSWRDVNRARMRAGYQCGGRERGQGRKWRQGKDDDKGRGNEGDNK